MQRSRNLEDIIKENANENEISLGQYQQDLVHRILYLVNIAVCLRQGPHQHLAITQGTIRNVDTEVHATNKLDIADHIVEFPVPKDHYTEENALIFGHIMKSESDQRDTLNGIVEGRGGRVRPRLQWSDTFT